MSMIRLLVVDDDPITRVLVLRFLAQNRDIEVAIAAGGRRVLQRLSQGEPVDWLLVDWNMPDMNGFDLVCAIRAERRYDHIRIMMLTAETCMDRVQAALDAGANEYLMKPFDKVMLLEKLALLGNT